MSGKRLTRADILGAKDEAFEDVDVREWEGVVRIRRLTGAERDLYERSLFRENPKVMNWDNVRARLVALTAVGEDGEPLFTAQDVAALGEKSGAVLDRLFDVARRLSGLRKEDVEELRKNSSTAPTVASVSS